jgi:hypothetical protein
MDSILFGKLEEELNLYPSDTRGREKNGCDWALDWS